MPPCSVLESPWRGPGLSPTLGQRDRCGGFRRSDGSLLKSTASEKASRRQRRRHGVTKGVTASQKASRRQESHHGGSLHRLSLFPFLRPFPSRPGVTQSHSRCLQEHRDHLLRNMALRSCRPLSLQDLPRLLFPKSDSGTLDQMARCCFLNFTLTPGPQTIRAPFR